MSMDDELFTPDEVLEGFSAKRARLLLFQIESRTAYLMMESRRTVNLYLTEEVVEQQNLAFFEALAEGRQLPVRPTIRDLERYAPQWQPLVSTTPTLQAALAHLLGEKYRFAQRDIPQIQQALELDSEAVQRAFQRQYRQPLDTIYIRQVSLLERIGWGWNKLGGWLENLPPFWTAYALTFTQLVGASMLALPIAIANVGLLPGLVILLIVGLINVLTIAAMAEAVVRSGSIRYQGNYLRRLVQDYLGRTGSTLLSVIVIFHCSLGLIALYMGFSLTLAGVLPVSSEIWVAVLFLLGFVVVWRNALAATVTSALVVGAVSIVLIIILSGLALIHLQPLYLLHMRLPFLHGAPFEPALLGLIFGVVFSSYFGHFSASSCARVVLQRDPGGRSLIWGCVAAMVSVMSLYMLWDIAVNGAVAPQSLIGLSGTALVPLATLVGPVATVCGVALAILTMGMASIHMSVTLISMIQEWIPGQASHTLILSRRRGSLICTSREADSVRLALTYLGLRGQQAQFRLELRQKEVVRRHDFSVDSHWEASTLLAELAPNLPSRSIQLALQVVKASVETVRLQCTTTMHLAYEGTWDTLGFDFLHRDDAEEDVQINVVRWLAGRDSASLEEITDFLHSEPHPAALLSTLLEQGSIVETREHGQTLYQAHFAPRRRRQLPSALEEALDNAEKMEVRERNAAQRLQRWMWLRQMKELVQGEKARSWLAMTPLLLLFLFVEWLLAHNLDSFSQLLSFRGVVTVAVVGSVFPILLLLASRRKGENVPQLVLPVLAHPLLAGGILLIAIGSLLLHGLVIWQDPFQRGIALLVAGVVMITTLLMVRQGVFARRLVIEVRQELAREEVISTFTVTDCGQRATQARVELSYTDGEATYQAASGAIAQFENLCMAKFSLPATTAQELRVWLHRVTAEGQSKNLPAFVKVSSGRNIREFHLDGVDKQFVLPLGAIVKQEYGESSEEMRQLVIEVLLSTCSNRGIDCNAGKA